jgi:hypothetical protein
MLSKSTDDRGAIRSQPAVHRPAVALQHRDRCVWAVAADRVFIITDDPQVAKAVEVLPRVI